MKFDIKKLVEKHTQDDVVNYEELNKEVNETANKQINDVVAKQKPDLAKLQSEAINEFLKDNSFKDTSDFKAFVKKGTSEEKEKRLEAEEQLESYKNEVQEKYKDYDDVKAQNKGLQNSKYFMELGVKDTKQQGYLNYQYDNREDQEDGVSFSDFMKTEVEANPKMYTESKSVQTAVSTKATPKASDKFGWETALEARTGIKLDD